jgi:hypothetical protein
MTARQYRAALSRLGLSQAGAAALVGADPRTSRRWALDERAVPESVAILLRLMLAGKIAAADINAVRDDR